MILLITIVVIAWIALSAFFLVSVCMMSSVANQTELLPDDKFPRQRYYIEDGSSEEVATQPSVKASTW